MLGVDVSTNEDLTGKVFGLELYAAAQKPAHQSVVSGSCNSVRRRMAAQGVRRDKAALSSGCKSHPATAPAGSNRSSYGGNEVAEAFG